jgi:hypothetical protein
MPPGTDLAGKAGAQRAPEEERCGKVPDPRWNWLGVITLMEFQERLINRFKKIVNNFWITLVELVLTHNGVQRDKVGRCGAF